MTSIRPLLAFLVVVSLLIIGAIIWLWPATRTGAQREGRPDCTPAQPCMAVVIDDIGRDERVLGQLLALPADLTFAVLPHAEFSPSCVRRLQRAGREYLAHVPMEPHNTSRITDEPVVLRRSQPFETLLDDALARVPGAAGISNHMGSALSEDRPSVERVLRKVQRRGSLFFDSRTSARSRFCAVARRMGVLCVARDYFVDDPAQQLDPRQRFALGHELALRRGWAIVVGHPHPKTVKGLRAYLAQLAACGAPAENCQWSRPVTIVAISHVVRQVYRL